MSESWLMWVKVKLCPNGKICFTVLMFYRVANLNVERNERMMQRHIHRYKQPKRVSTHAWIKHVLSICPNTQNIAHQTRQQKKCFIECLKELKYYPTCYNMFNPLSPEGFPIDE